MIWISESEATISMIIGYFIFLIFIQILVFISQIFAYSSHNRMFGGRMFFEFLFIRTRKKHVLLLLKLIAILTFIGVISLFLFIEIAILMAFIIFYITTYISIFFAYVVTIKSKEDPDNLEKKKVIKKSQYSINDFNNTEYNNIFKKYVAISIVSIVIGIFLMYMSYNDPYVGNFDLINIIFFIFAVNLVIWIGFYLANYNQIRIENSNLLLVNRYRTKTIDIETIKQIKFTNDNMVIEYKNITKKIRFKFNFSDDHNVPKIIQYEVFSNAINMDLFDTNQNDLIIIKMI